LVPAPLCYKFLVTIEKKINFMKQQDNQNIEKFIEMVKESKVFMLITQEKMLQIYRVGSWV